MMSGELKFDSSCPTYAVVDMKKKRIKESKLEENSTDVALYAVVDKKKKKKKTALSQQNVENYYSHVEVEHTMSSDVEEEISKPTFSMLDCNKASVPVLSTSSSVPHSSRGKNWKPPPRVLQFVYAIIVIILLLFVLAMAICTAVAFAMISRLRSESLSTQSIAEMQQNKTCNDTFHPIINMKNYENITCNNTFLSTTNTENTEQINKTLNNLLTNLKSDYSYLQDIFTDNSLFLGLVSDCTIRKWFGHSSLRECVHSIIDIFGRSIFIPAPSCQVIHKVNPNSSSDYYWVMSSDGSSIRVYCDMTKSCGNVTGGLTRVAVLNNQTRSNYCLNDLKIVGTQCVRTSPDPGCSSTVFSLMNMTYSHICGTVKGRWFGSPGAFSDRSVDTTINDNYVDGISLTYGNESNRTHIWTFSADSTGDCSRGLPKYVGSNHSCLKRDTDNACLMQVMSCSLPFVRQLQSPVTEDIELRLCQDQSRHSSAQEGIYVGDMEIFVW